MSIVEILEIYDCLSKEDRTGVSLLQICRETKVSSPQVRKYLSVFSGFSVRVGSRSCYTLNRFGGTQCSKKCLIEKIDNTKRDKALTSLGFVTFGCGLAVAISVNAFNGL